MAAPESEDPMESPGGRGDVFLAALGYVPVLNLVPLARRPKSRFLLYHTRQGLYLFTVFLLLFVVLAGLFYALVTQGLFNKPVVKQTLAVLIVLVFGVYVVVDLILIVSVFQKKMVMLPVLGELAGER